MKNCKTGVDYASHELERAGAKKQACGNRRFGQYIHPRDNKPDKRSL